MRTSPQTGSISGSPSDRLNSWKEIATFFDKDVRTVRRWEEARNLPVHRMPGGSRSGVFAYVSELELWLAEAWKNEAASQNGTAPGTPDSDLPATLPTPESLPDPASPRIERRIAQPSPAQTSQTESPTQAPPEALDSAVAQPQSWFRRPTLLIPVLASIVLVFFVVYRLSLPAAQTTSGQTISGAASTVPEAQELYLRGLYLWNQRTEASLTEAIDLFTQAIVHDPKFSAAYAGLADSYILIRQYGNMPDNEAFPRALAASRQALALDPTSPEAHRSYAFLLNYWMWDFPAADREFHRSIQLRPDDAQTHHWYATSLYSTEHYQQAIQEIDIARGLQPDSIAILANRGLLLQATDEQEALNYLLKLESVNPKFPSIHTYLAHLYLQQRDFKQFLEESRDCAMLLGDDAETNLYSRAQEELSAHGPEPMLRFLAQEKARAVDNGARDAMLPAVLYATLKDQPHSLHYVQIAGQRREANFIMMNQDPIFKVFEQTPEYQALLTLRNTPLDAETALKTPSAAAQP